MSWKKHFKTANTVLPAGTRVAMPGAAMSSQPTWLPEVYEGPADRLMRYMQYDQMDLDDTVNAALDTIAEFSTQMDEKTGLPVVLNFSEEPNPSELRILEKTLKQWIRLNQIKKRVFRIFRSTIKYGDQFFIRDPETFRLIWVDPAKVDKLIVNESEGKKVEVYYIRDIDLNLQELVGTKISHTYDHGYGRTPPFANIPQAVSPQQYSGYSAVTPGGMPDFGGAYQQQVTPVDAAHVLHISLTEGMDNNWPFGNSILEAIYKVYKQKELLEDSILIYRVHRAPERRIFTIDVGDMPPNKAQAYLERVRLEVQQKRIPNRGPNDNNSIIDSTYNPMCETLSTRIPLLDGRTLTLQEIINEYESGNKLWIYSIDESTGRIAPGPVSWAGVTRGNAEIVKVSISNGKEITCTPDHLFPIVGKGFVCADELQVDDLLYNFDVRVHTLEDGTKVTQIYDYELTDWINVSDMANEFFAAHSIDPKPEFNNPLESNFDGNFENRKVVSVEHLDEKEDTGTITVDANEEYHNYHTFATEAGIFIKNSMLEDYFFASTADGRGSTVTTLPGGCFSMDTKISLLSGEEASIAEIRDRMENGEQLWTYSCHPETGNIKPGQITWAGVTQKSAKVMKINLSNGSEIICTPDHKFPRFEVGFVEAKDLSIGDNLIPLTRSKIFNYEIFHDPFINHWEYTHRMVMDEVDGSTIFDDNTIVHHIDYNRLNNNPKNLCFMDFDEHRRLFNELSMNVEARSATLEEYNERVRWVGEVKEIGTLEPTVDVLVESVEYLDDEIEVGTITVDEMELLHDYHTFALSAGVFAKNSNLGEIDDLKYFNNKMLRALRVPSAYWPTGPEDGTNTYTDGRVGTAFIQEYRFTKYCQRLQQLIIENLDLEFKLFLKHRGFTIDNSIFSLEFTEPQNFAKYRMIEIDGAHAGVFTQLEAIPYLSKRFKMKRYLGLDEDEILENERLWREEQTDEEPPDEEVTPGMRAVGVEPFGDDLDLDDEVGEPPGEGEEGIEGVEGGEEGGEETPPA